MWNYVRQGIGIGTGLLIVLAVLVLRLLVMGAIFLAPMEIGTTDGSSEVTPIAAPP